MNIRPPHFPTQRAWEKYKSECMIEHHRFLIDSLTDETTDEPFEGHHVRVKTMILEMDVMRHEHEITY